MRVIIAEKPSVARVIADELGIREKGDGHILCTDGTEVTWCFGHLLELKTPDAYLPESVPVTKNGTKQWRMEDLPIIPGRWEKELRHDSGVKKQYGLIRDLVKKADTVVNAGDPDREGQNLVDEVIERLGYKGKVLRYWCSAMDQVSVKRALNKLEPNEKYVPWGVASECRQHSDWLIGMNLSRYLTLKHRPKSVISAGRVQTTTLKLIVDRDLGIENFKSVPYWQLRGTFRVQSDTYTGLWQIPEDLKDPEGHLTDRNTVDEALNRMVAGSQAEVISYTQKLKAEKPPVLYTLTSLQSESSSHGLSAKKTLDIAQWLYENKFTTYPRTSCPHLPEAQRTDAAQIITNIAQAFPSWQKTLKNADPQRKTAVWNDKAVNQEAHTGLAPTLTAVTPDMIAKWPEENRLIYEMICRRYAAAFMPDHSFYETVIETALSKTGDRFISKGKKTVDPGWRALISGKTAKSKDKEDDVDETGELPVLRKGQSGTLESLNEIAKKTTPPKRFTEGTLVAAMEKIAAYVTDPEEKKILKETSGIGTAATRAEIIELLKDRGYIAVKSKALVSTDFGRQVISVMPELLKSPGMTAQAEDDLRSIQDGTGDPAQFEEKTIKQMRQMMKEAEAHETIQAGSDVQICPSCGKKALYRNESRYRKGEYYHRCAECGAMFNDGSDGTPGEMRIYADCPSCGSRIRRIKDKNGKPYWPCPKCHKSFEDNAGKPGNARPSALPETKCPSCGGVLRRYESKFTLGTFTWYCSGCKSRFTDENGKPGKKQESSSKVFKCPDCGKETVFYVKSRDHFWCKSCNANFENIKGKPGAKIVNKSGK